MSRPTKSPFAAKIRWLLENESLWRGYPKPRRPHMLKHHDIVFRAMQRAGLYARNVVAEEADIAELINQARRVRAKRQRAIDVRAHILSKV